MSNRTGFRLLVSTLLTCGLVLAVFSQPLPSAQAVDPNLVGYVNPFIGTANLGDVFPGADYPFGMMQWSPDTDKMIWSGGYDYKDTAIQGFSLTHFSGRAAECYEDFPFMPTVGPLTSSPGTNWSSYNQTFSHADERAGAGYYEVKLGNGVQVDLSVTQRTGLGRFTFPASSTQSTLLISNTDQLLGADSSNFAINESDNSITGTVHPTRCGGASRGYNIYFVAQFDRAFSGYGTWSGDSLFPGSTSVDNPQAGSYVTFNTSVVQVKVGISYVSVANALDNLNKEQVRGVWNYDNVKSGAQNAWNARLNSIQVTGGSTDSKTVFYTGLYHSMIHPNITSDYNGQYIGYDNKVHTMLEGHAYYENQTSWDNYRTQMRLLAIIAPKETADMVRSLLLISHHDYDKSLTLPTTDPNYGKGGGLPRWAMIGDNSVSMQGDDQVVNIATAYAFGVTDFSTADALAIMDRTATVPGIKSGWLRWVEAREGLADYLSKGYVPYVAGSDPGRGSASLTLEYANNDFAIAQFARAINDTAKYDYYLQRSENWQNLWYAQAGGDGFTGYIAPRQADGNWISNFSPSSQAGFTEANSAQITWMLPFNYKGLFDKLGVTAALGGNAAALQRLDYHFGSFVDNANNLQFGNFAINANDSHAWMGNEPESGAPYAYAFAGAPYKTQALVRTIINKYYKNAPAGIPGNDDGGAMGSWAVLSMMGLFPEIPGVAGFVVSTPFFSSVTIRIAGNHTIQLNAAGASDANKYIQSLRLTNSKLTNATYNSSWLPWSALKEGATLDFTLGTVANTSWGSAANQAPPSHDMPDDGSLFYETENLTVASTSSGDTHRIITANEFSGGRGTILDANQVGDYVSYTLNIPQAGSYDIRVGVKKLNSRGIWQLTSPAISASTLQVQDEFVISQDFTELDVGTATVTGGNVNFKFTVTGQNDRSSGYAIAFDYIRLIPR